MNVNNNKIYIFLKYLLSKRVILFSQTRCDGFESILSALIKSIDEKALSETENSTKRKKNRILFFIDEENNNKKKNTSNMYLRKDEFKTIMKTTTNLIQ